MFDYNVAFRYTKKTCANHGIITWTSFSNKAAFDAFYTEKIKADLEVVEKGISQERAIELVRSTPFSCRIAAAVQDATDDDGTLDKYMLSMNMLNAIAADRL